MPPPGQQGRGSYVWVPEVSDTAAVNEEQFEADKLVDDMAIDDNDGSAQTEDYLDPYAAEVNDFPEMENVDETGIGEDDALEYAENFA